MNWLNRIWRWVSVPKNQRTLAFIGGGLVVAVGGIYKYFEDSKTDPKAPNVSMVANGNANTQVSGNSIITSPTINGDGNVINTGNIYKSADYQALNAELEKVKQHIQSYPDDPSFKKELGVAQQNIEDFERDVLKLAEDFNKTPINTERLRLAKQYFDTGDYKAARTILDAEGMNHDQNSLLDKKKRLDTEKAELDEQLGNNATEFLLKAKLTAIDYSLPDRIAQTSSFFEKALKSARTPNNLFEYAYFLQENNQFKASELDYQEALG
ncbi:tetratricopeptide repeat protein, partial [Methylomonas methanica]|uniref:tetratricopeptide repeat protein n=1 Tax=Methylomonas methanica TaxID=421 RepID=UPI000AA03099